MPKTVIFILFLIVYILYYFGTYWLINKLLDKGKNITFLENELIIIVSSVFFFAFVFLIGQFFDFKLFLLFFFASNIGLIIAALFGSIIGSPKRPYAEIGGWIGYNFGTVNRRFSNILLGISFIISVAYPVIVGRIYFHENSQHILRIEVVKYSSALILFLFLTELPITIGLLSSCYIDEDSRARVLINKFTSVIIFSVLISLLFWTFSPEESSRQFQIGSLNFYYSPRLVVLILAFIFLFLALPYIIGLQRSKNYRHDFFETNSKILNQIIDTINLSTKDNLSEKLSTVQRNIEQQLNRLIENEIGILIGTKYDEYKSEQEVPQAELKAYKFYKKARDFDIRFNQYDFFFTVYYKLDELKSIVEDTEQSVDSKDLFSKKYTEYFKDYKKDIIQKNESRGKTNPILLVGILSIILPFTSQVLSEIGKHIVSIIKNL